MLNTPNVTKLASYSDRELVGLLRGHASNAEIEGAHRVANFMRQAADRLATLSPSPTEEGLAEELAALVHEVSNAHRLHDQIEPHDATSFAIYTRKLNEAKLVLANHVLDKWGPILAALSPAVDEAAVERAARSAIAKFELARTEVVNPVNGTRPYSYVTFAGAKIEFQQTELKYHNGSVVYDAATDKAAAQADCINEMMMELAYAAARAALSASGPTPPSDVARLREALTKLAVDAKIALFSGDVGKTGWIIDQMTMLPVLASQPTPSGDADHPLARMVALDEEIEAENPGWMTGEPT